MKGKKEKSKLLRRILCAALALGIAAFMIFGTVMSAFADSGDVLPLAKDTKEDKPEELLFSKSGILYEATTDQVLFEQNADVEAPMASMTKVMTAVVVLEGADVRQVTMSGRLLTPEIPGLVRAWQSEGDTMIELESGHYAFNWR